MTKLEEIARAICEESGLTWESATQNYRERCADFALAAVRAMREPSEAMQKAGFRTNVIMNKGGCKGVPESAIEMTFKDWHDPGKVRAKIEETGVCRIARVTAPADEPWRAMIDSILSEAGEKP
jgi:hypothetical protein